MNILFPLNPVSNNPTDFIDETFKEEANAVKLIGCNYYYLDFDLFDRENILKTNLAQKSESEEKELIVYRGWMLKSSQYSLLYDKLYEMGYQLINSAAQYQRCHHFGEVAHVYSDRTPQYIFKPNLSKELFERLYKTQTAMEDLLNEIESFKSDYFLLKDAVKSEKNYHPELFKISSKLSPSELREKIIAFIDKRGRNYNPGLMFKQYVQLKKFFFKIDEQEKELTNEYRLFILNNRVISCKQNSGLNTHNIKHNIPNPNEIMHWSKGVMSNFFTVDVGELEDGSWTVIETGDGQVSGLSTSQNMLEFYKKLEEVLLSEVL